jgi:hypothetical protein
MWTGGVLILTGLAARIELPEPKQAEDGFNEGVNQVKSGYLSQNRNKLFTASNNPMRVARQTTSGGHDNPAMTPQTNELPARALSTETSLSELHFEYVFASVRSRTAPCVIHAIICSLDLWDTVHCYPINAASPFTINIGGLLAT